MIGKQDADGSFETTNKLRRIGKEECVLLIDILRYISEGSSSGEGPRDTKNSFRCRCLSVTALFHSDRKLTFGAFDEPTGQCSDCAKLSLAVLEAIEEFYSKKRFALRCSG